jgi:hypothetical protein
VRVALVPVALLWMLAFRRARGRAGGVALPAVWGSVRPVGARLLQVRGVGAVRAVPAALHAVPVDSDLTAVVPDHHLVVRDAYGSDAARSGRAVGSHYNPALCHRQPGVQHDGVRGFRACASWVDQFRATSATLTTRRVRLRCTTVGEAHGGAHLAS